MVYHADWRVACDTMLTDDWLWNLYATTYTTSMLVYITDTSIFYLSCYMITTTNYNDNIILL